MVYKVDKKLLVEHLLDYCITDNATDHKIHIQSTCVSKSEHLSNYYDNIHPYDMQRSFFHNMIFKLYLLQHLTNFDFLTSQWQHT